MIEIICYDSKTSLFKFSEFKELTCFYSLFASCSIVARLQTGNFPERSTSQQ